MKTITLKDNDLQAAAQEGMDTFVKLFVDATREAIGGEVTAENIASLSADQATLLAWAAVHEEVMDGGFVQLIHNGYGPFVFLNPFAKAVRGWGMDAFAKLVYDAGRLYREHRRALEADCTDEEFMALFEQHPQFDDLDDAFVDNEEQWTEQVARYIDGHIGHFAVIIEE